MLLAHQELAGLKYMLKQLGNEALRNEIFQLWDEYEQQVFGLCAWLPAALHSTLKRLISSYLDLTFFARTPWKQSSLRITIGLRCVCKR